MAKRAADERGFDWPPTDSDLARIDILSTVAVGTEVARNVPRPSTRATRPAAVPRSFGRLDGLILLAAGMLLGSAVPSLDTAPPTRVGLRAAITDPTLAPATLSATTLSRPAPVETDAVGPSPASEGPSAAGATTVAEVAARPAPTPMARTPLPADPRARQVVAVVQAYGRAWSRMDARAARAVMPSADVDALTRVFTSLREQRLTLSGCRVSGTGASATASCTVTRRYRPRRGEHSTRIERGRWQFHVERTAQRWVITDVEQG